MPNQDSTTCETKQVSTRLNPIRLIDYFIEIIAEKSHTFQEGDEVYTRKIIHCTPNIEHTDFPLPEGLPYFCIPEPLYDGRNNDPSSNMKIPFSKSPKWYSFLLTSGNGSRAYGFVCHFYEASQYATADVKWIPHAFCFISHYPFFTLFRELLRYIYNIYHQYTQPQVIAMKLKDACQGKEQHWLMLSPRQALDTNVMKSGILSTTSSFYTFIQAIVEQTIAPTSGNELVLNIISMNHEFPSKRLVSYHYHRGKRTHMDDYCIQTLCQCLSLRNIIYIINCMLMEQRILVHSQHEDLLTPVCEGLTSLLFPFTWEHVYIPFLPVKLIEYLYAPLPFLVGLHSSSLATTIGSEMFSSCVVVHLDKDQVIAPIRFSNPVRTSESIITKRNSGTYDENRVSDVADNLVSFPYDLVEDLILKKLDYGMLPKPHNSTTFHSFSYDAYVNDAKEDNTQDEQDNQTVIHEKDDLSDIEVTFDHGPLGITFESTHLRLLAVSGFELGKSDGPINPLLPCVSSVIKAFPRLPNGLPGPAERCRKLSVGNFLLEINGETTLDLSYHETIDALRKARRPLTLKFLQIRRNPFETACAFVQRMQLSSSFAIQPINNTSPYINRNRLRPWVDCMRSSFALFFATLLEDYESYITIKYEDEPQSPLDKKLIESNKSMTVKFDKDAYLKSQPCEETHFFLKEFMRTQSFVDFINDSALCSKSGAMNSNVANRFSQVELFKQCLHLLCESEQPDKAILLLFERDPTPLEHIELCIPTSHTNIIPEVHNIKTSIKNQTVLSEELEMVKPFRGNN